MPSRSLPFAALWPSFPYPHPRESTGTFYPFSRARCLVAAPHTPHTTSVHGRVILSGNSPPYACLRTRKGGIRGPRIRSARLSSPATCDCSPPHAYERATHHSVVRKSSSLRQCDGCAQTCFLKAFAWHSSYFFVMQRDRTGDRRRDAMRLRRRRARGEGEKQEKQLPWERSCSLHFDSNL